MSFCENFLYLLVCNFEFKSLPVMDYLRLLMLIDHLVQYLLCKFVSILENLSNLSIYLKILKILYIVSDIRLSFYFLCLDSIHIFMPINMKSIYYLDSLHFFPYL